MADPKTPASDHYSKEVARLNASRAELAKIADGAALYSTKAQREEMRAHANALREPVQPGLEGYQAAVKQAQAAHADLSRFQSNLNEQYRERFAPAISAAGTRMVDVRMDLERATAAAPARAQTVAQPELAKTGAAPTAAEARQQTGAAVKELATDLERARAHTRDVAHQLAGRYEKGSPQRAELEKAESVLRGGAPRNGAEAKAQAEATLDAMRTVFKQQNALHQAGKMTPEDMATVAKQAVPMAQSMASLQQSLGKLNVTEAQYANVRLDEPTKQAAQARDSQHRTDVAKARGGLSEASTAAGAVLAPFQAALADTREARQALSSAERTVGQAREVLNGLKEAEAGSMQGLSKAGEELGKAREAYGKAAEQYESARWAATYTDAGGARAATTEYQAERELKAATAVLDKAQAGMAQAEKTFNTAQAAVEGQQSKVAELDKGVEAARAQLASREQHQANLQEKASGAVAQIQEKEARLAKVEKREPRDVAVLLPGAADALQAVRAVQYDRPPQAVLRGETVASMAQDASRSRGEAPTTAAAAPLSEAKSSSFAAAVGKSIASATISATNQAEATKEAVRQDLLKGDPNRVLDAASGTTPLMVARRFGMSDVVTDLLARGADPNARNVEGKTAADMQPQRETVPAMPREKSTAELAMEKRLQEFADRADTVPRTVAEALNKDTPSLAEQFTKSNTGMGEQYASLKNELTNGPAAPKPERSHER